MQTTEIQTKHAQLSAFETRYAYDAGYLHELVNASEGAYEAFAAAQGLPAFRWALPTDAHFVALVATMRFEDCGACANLNLKMAAESGVDRPILRALVVDPASLPGHLRDIHDHARHVATREPAAPDDLDRVDRLRAHYGEEAFAELAAAITGARLYPTMKRAMGRFVACEPLTYDELTAD
ncbi:MAG: hypothetical protein AAF726_21245 [Planctomycetota bacterium]